MSGFALGLITDRFLGDVDRIARYTHNDVLSLTSLFFLRFSSLGGVGQVLGRGAEPNS